MPILDQLLTEQRNPASAEIDTVDTEAALRIINAEDRTVADAVADAIPQISRAVDGIVERLRQGGRLLYLGAGTSGRLGVLDASECPPTYSVPPDLVQGVMAGGEAALSRATEANEDDPQLGARDVASRALTSQDVVFGIAASGRTPYVIGAVRYAREQGALTVALSCVPGAALSQEVDLPIEVPTGAEIVTGSTRMKAGTATKLVLNMVSTTAMVQLGHVYGNLMVNVQPKNEKLVARAHRIICQATGASVEEAASLLDAAGRSVKTAIVMKKLGLERAPAEQRLAASNGRIRQAIEQ